MLGLVPADTVRSDCAHEEHAPFPVPLEVQVCRHSWNPPAYATAQPPPASPVMLGLVFADTVRPDCAHEEHAPFPVPLKVQVSRFLLRPPAYPPPNLLRPAP